MGDSNDRDLNLYPSGNSYVLHLNFPVRNVSRVDLVSARVPNTVYNLNSTSIVFTVVGSSSVTLPQGFYSAYGLATAVTTAGPLTLTYLPNEGHFLFSSSTSFNFTIVSKEFATMVGLSNNVAYQSYSATSADPGYTQIYRSVNVINMSMNEFIYLDIDELRTPNHVATGSLGTTGTISGSNAGRSFAPVILDVGSACMKNFKETEYKISVQYPEPIGVLSRLTVRWYDRNGSLLNFRGLDTNAFVLRLHTVEEERLPPPAPLEELELKRFIDAINVAPPPPPEKRRKIPWTLIALVILIGTIFYFNVLRRRPSVLVQS